jgi:Spy/CpxP family protein refolding chaperone
MEKNARTRVVAALVLAVVFASGALLGLAVDRSLESESAERVEEADEGERRRRVPMYEQVGPSESQMISIDSIVEEHRARMSSLHAEFRSAYNPRYQALLEETREAIKGVFTPEQAMAYDSLLKARDRRRAERGSRENRE